MKIKDFWLVLVLLPTLVMAEGVNTNNGNFYIEVPDIIPTSGKGLGLSLLRTYNSKSSGIGWFGYGWGSTYETRLVVMPDGSVVVRESGAGKINHYLPSQGILPAGVEKILAAAIKRDSLETSEVDALRKELRSDADFRYQKVREYGIESQLHVGQTAQSPSCPSCSVIRTSNGYQRTTFLLDKDYFDSAGRLVRQESKGYWLNIHYVGQHPDRIEDSSRNKLFLKWTAFGHVAETRAVANTRSKKVQVVRYRYDEKDNLILSEEPTVVINRYRYDGSHNMTYVEYLDVQKNELASEDINYDENGLATSVSGSDGSKAVYEYRSDPNNPSHYWTDTKKIRANGKRTSKEEEFLVITDNAGIQHVDHKTKSLSEESQDEIEADPSHDMEVAANEGGFPDETIHDQRSKRISAIVSTKGSTVFTYDKSGHLLRVFNANGQLIRLTYDRKYRVSRMLETNQASGVRHLVQFKYNTHNQLSQIRLAGKGEINYSYDSNGQFVRPGTEQRSKNYSVVIDVLNPQLDSIMRVGCLNLGKKIN